MVDIAISTTPLIVNAALLPVVQLPVATESPIILSGDLNKINPLRSNNEYQIPCSPDDVSNAPKPFKRHRRNGKAGSHHRRSVHKKRISSQRSCPISLEQSKKLKRECLSKTRIPPDFSRSRNGRPMAPYNTTQFIMEQNDLQLGSPRVTKHCCSDDLDVLSDDPDWISDGTSDSSTNCQSDNCPNSSTNGVKEQIEESMDGGFGQIYDNVINERLTCMTKEDLVKECIELDAKNTKLERVLADSRKSPIISLSE